MPEIYFASTLIFKKSAKFRPRIPSFSSLLISSDSTNPLSICGRTQMLQHVPVRRLPHCDQRCARVGGVASRLSTDRQTARPASGLQDSEVCEEYEHENDYDDDEQGHQEMDDGPPSGHETVDRTSEGEDERGKNAQAGSRSSK